MHGMLCVVYEETPDAMKYVLLLLFLHVNFFVKAQESDQRKLRYEEIVPVSDLDELQLFDNAREWILSSFTPGDQIIAQEQGQRIIATGQLLLEDRGGGCVIVNGRLEYKLILLFKSGRYQYTFDKLFHHYAISCGEYGGYPVSEPLAQSRIKGKRLQKILSEIDFKMNYLITEMNDAISGATQQAGL